MPTRIIVPLLGEGVEEVTIVKWLKEEGESVEEYEGLVEVETDKVITEIPSPVSGTVLQIDTPQEGQAVPVGDILAWIGKPGESIPKQEGKLTDVQEKPAEEIISTETKIEQPRTSVSVPTTDIGEDKTPKDVVKIRPGRDPNLGFISPLVAKIATEADLDLSQVPGSGLKGRITKKDVLSYIESGTKETVSTRAPKTTPAITPTPVPSSLPRNPWQCH